MAFGKGNQLTTKTSTTVSRSDSKRPEQTDRAKDFKPNYCRETGLGANTKKYGRL